jgi:ABC-2 type transport system permease protein
MSTTLTIAKRELRSSFDSPVAYVVICLSLVALGFVFFFLGDFWQAGRASFQTLFLWIPRGLSFVVVPVVTMRLLAEEKRSGTLEMLITLPARDHSVILGKFLGAWALVLVLLGTTLLYPFLMFEWPWHLGSLDWGPVFAGYLGLVVYSAAAVSIGLLVSSLTESQIIALFAMHFIGFAVDAIGNKTLQNVAAFVSFDARLAPFARGLVNTRDLVFFITITIGCLMASFRALERRKWA